MLVRSFRLSDHVGTQGLLSNALSETCYVDTMGAFAKQLSWDSELVMVAESDQQLVGMIIGTIDNNKGYYYRLAVHSDYRRRGIGKALIQALRTKFQQRDVSRIVVNVDEHNRPILPVYEKAGYGTDDFLQPQKPLKIMIS